MKVLFIGDVHLSDTAPRSRRDDYTAAILNKLAQIAEIAESYDYAVFMGDVFHKKRPDRNSHALVQAFMDVLKKFPEGRTYSIVGNHDIRGGNMSTLSEQPLGVIFKTGFLKWLNRDLILTDSTATVQLSPLNFTYETETHLPSFDCERIDGADFVVRVSHVAVLPGGLPPSIYNMPHVHLKDIWAAEQKWDLMVNGHVHKASEVLEYHGRYFINTGSICRGALTESVFDKVPAVLGVELVRGEKPKFEWHDLEVVPAKEVFKVEEHYRKKEIKNELDSFVKSVVDSDDDVSAMAQSLDIKDLLEQYLKNKDIEDSVKNKVREYLVPNASN